MREAAEGVVVERDVQPAVFQEVLKWIYVGSVSEGAVNAMGEYLLLAANKYGCEALKQQCEVELCRGLTVRNASARLVLSDQAEAVQLKEIDLCGNELAALPAELLPAGSSLPAASAAARPSTASA